MTIIISLDVGYYSDKVSPIKLFNNRYKPEGGNSLGGKP